MNKKLFLFCAFFSLFASLKAQDYFPDNKGVKADKNTNYTVFTHAKIHVNPTEIIEDGMFAIRDGKITAVGKSIPVPKNAVVIDLTGKTVYPSFVEVFSSFGIDTEKKGNSWGSQQYGPSREGYYWNDHIRPETLALPFFDYDNSKAKALQKLGFGAVNTHVPEGIMQGTGILVTLNSSGTTGDRLLKSQSVQYLSFEKGSFSKQAYPSSIMGAMALLRQTYLDAAWYAKGNIQNKDLSLEAVNAHKGLRSIFKTDNLLNVFRADKIANEFGISYTLLASGQEYERIEDIKTTNTTFILPLNFPKPFDLSNPYMASFVSLEKMKDWNQAPINPGVLEENAVRFALTTYSAEKNFKKNLLKAIVYGLSKETALAALTTVPAKLLGMEGQLGVLRKGALANFIITSGDYFDKETIVFENWVQGVPYRFHPMDVIDLSGAYTLRIDGKEYSLKISGKPTKPKVKIASDSMKLGAKADYKNNWLNVLISTPDTTQTGYIRLVAKITAPADSFSGKAILTDGQSASFTAVKTQSDSNTEKEKKKAEKQPKTHEVLPVSFPNTAYGYLEPPKQQDILFKNATVWTNEAAGIVESTDVLVKDGKIAAIGKDLKAHGAKIIDATGKHLTSGIIDEHSHIAASAINEGGQNSSAEVNMADVIDPNDINIYRNLAGGVTTVQLLHGSANPIGGQSAILKLRWGGSPEDMLMDNPPKFIKFALGENVKQANWGNGSRFPQTRMGVEQVFVDYFTRANAYAKKKASGQPYRKDLEMETLVEILNSERFISCHSYVASEILMLMDVAENFGFRINTFTHILEGYKVADRMKEHGVGASTFSDWWAYKYEVKDAIPQNAAIMNDMGIITAINSDDAEMSRHLNQEAAKSVKYGGLSEEEAWKLVTLNPAKLLHIDDRVGSIKVGKEADLVLWTDNPLSVYAKAVKTMIGGVVYFSLERDQKLRNSIDRQKNKIAKQMIQAKNAGIKTQPIKAQEKEEMHCDTVHL